MTQRNEDTVRQHYLKNFKRENSPEAHFNLDIEKEIGEKLVDLMKKEGITYDIAYGCLQYAYNLLKYESNFLKLN